MFLLKKENRDYALKALKKCLVKSKTVWTQYVGVTTGFLQSNGKDLVDSFNANSTQFQSLLDNKIFGIVSGLCCILAIYIKINDKAKEAKVKDSNDTA